MSSLKIVFAGTPQFAAQHLEGLLDNGIEICAVVSQPDKPGKRGKKLIPSPVKLVAEAHGLPVIQPEKFVAQDLAPFNPDLLIVVAYGQILRQSLLDTPTYGCLNVHGSILPRWRGAAPIQRAVEAGDKETGICIMQMDAGLDTGPVFHEARTSIAPSETSAELSERLIELGVEGLLAVLKDKVASGEEPIPQSEIGASYAKKILKQEAQLDWSEPAENLRNKIHAFNPDPICFALLEHDGQALRVKVHHVANIEACPIETKSGEIKPGEIIDVRNEGVLVATGSGALLIDKLQLPLGKGAVLNGRDILNARADIIHSGATFT
jgi:methionyl-tRNA formyltransferase